MKQITEIDDPRLVKALAHPLRIHILRVLQDRVASPSELAEEVSAPLGNVSYHVRFLARVGLLDLVDTRPRRGALEHYYRARSKVRITDKAWAQVPDIVKNAMAGASLDQIVRYIGAGASIGGFEHKESQVNRTPLTLDKKGFAELAAAVRELLKRADQIERDSAERIASNHSDGELSTGLVTMLFEAPPPEAGLLTPEEKVRPRTKRRRTPAPTR